MREWRVFDLRPQLLEVQKGAVEVPREVVAVVEHHLSTHDIDALHTDQVLATISDPERCLKPTPRATKSQNTAKTP